MLEISLKKPSTKKIREDILYDLIIVGAGPAGFTSAIYASRSLMKTVIIDSGPAGGLASTTEFLENYPGFPDGISGVELMSLFQKQAERFGAKLSDNTLIKSVDFSGNEKIVVTDKGTYHSKTVIIATGTRPKELGIKGEKKFKGRGISYCATCDAPLFKNKDIVVIGCGSSGIQEGLYLLQFVKSVTFVEFLPYMTAEPILQERIKQKDNVKFLLNHKVVEIMGNEKIEAVKVEDRKSEKENIIPTEGIFIYVGLIPNSELFNVEKDQKGYIKADDLLKTNVEGIFVAGDVRKKHLRQIATAVGDGAVAAFSAKHYLESKS